MEYRNRFSELSEEEQDKILQCGFWLFEYIWEVSKKEDVYAILHRKIKGEVSRNEKVLAQQYSRKESAFLKELEVKQEEIENLRKECCILRNIHKDDSKLSLLSEQLGQFRMEFSNFMSPHRVGKTGEGIVYNILSERFPKCPIRDVSGERGNGDIYMEYGDVRIMFEVKCSSEESLRSHPTETLGRFKSDAKKSIESGRTNSAVFVSVRSPSIPGHGILDVEEYASSIGKFYLLYVSDILGYPDRLLNVVEMCRFLHINSDDEEKVRSILNNVSNMNIRLGDMTRMVKSMKSNINKQYKVCRELETEISNMVYLLKGMDIGERDEKHTENLDKLGKLYASLVQKYQDTKITKAMMLKHIGDANIPEINQHNLGRSEFGYDMRNIKKLAKKYLGGDVDL
jgi:hypothetical protein